MATKRNSLSSWVFGTFLLALVGVPIQTTIADTCQVQLPASAIKVGELKICQSTYNGIVDQYSCQEYQAGTEYYRVLYKGGLVPKAIVKLNANRRERLVWSTIFGDQKIACSLVPPNGVPANAKHRGTGVCVDERDRAVPCSIFEYAAPRQSEYHRYLAYYHPAGTGASNVDTFVAGENKDAMVAEIAYQIGLSLLDSRCCSEKAIIYLEYAHHLFPQADFYRAAYDNAKSLLAARTSENDFDI